MLASAVQRSDSQSSPERWLKGGSKPVGQAAPLSTHWRVLPWRHRHLPAVVQGTQHNGGGAAASHRVWGRGAHACN